MREEAEKAIIAMIEAAQDAYNSGDPRFGLQNFIDTEELRLVSPSGIVQGWDALMRKVKSVDPSFDFGTLYYSDLEVKFLSERCALVTTKWDRTLNGKAYKGYSSAIFVETDKGWRVIHDQDTYFNP